MNDIIRNGDFATGFEVGYRAIKGTATYLPYTPYAPYTKYNSTAFLMGVRKGIESALGQTIDDIQDLCDNAR
ncbi:hypothetical protein [Pseudaminobacter sp. NGMCC 1.201702]|uniref:hypothetical protein n=1 Tax=Pseudaminobacter sp. NGMCC 1.201702 TaxID=3391825 RepID=UPI0039EE9346